MMRAGVLVCSQTLERRCSERDCRLADRVADDGVGEERDVEDNLFACDDERRRVGVDEVGFSTLEL